LVPLPIGSYLGGYLHIGAATHQTITLVIFGGFLVDIYNKDNKEEELTL
jgi:hypothetical protein